MTKIFNETRGSGYYFSQKKQTSEPCKIKIPKGEIFDSFHSTILDTHYGGSASLDSIRPEGEAGSGEVILYGSVKELST